MRIFKRTLAAVAVLVFTAGGPVGCTHHHAEVIEVPTNETTTVIHDEDDGGLFDILGDIIALPFRAIGALLDVIF